MPAWRARNLGIAQALQRAFQVVLEDVGHGHEFHVLVAGEHVDDGLRAAAAAADDAGPRRLFPAPRTSSGLTIVNVVAPAAAAVDPVSKDLLVIGIRIAYCSPRSGGVRRPVLEVG